MDKTKEQIQEYFNVFDKDGSGYIDKEEIKDLAKNVGLDWSDHKLDKIIKALDTNGDGKISFQEFYEYFLYGEQKEMDQLLEMKFQHIKNVNNLQKQLSQEYAHILNKNKEEGKQQYSVSLNVGDKSHLKYSIEFALRIGEENTNFSESLLKHFPIVDDNIIQLVFRYQCYHPEVMQEKCQELIEGLIEVGLNMMPPQISEKLTLFKDDLKIEYATLPDELLIRFYVDNQFIDNILLAYRQISGMFISEDTSILAKLKFQCAESLERNDVDFLNKIGRGCQASLDVTTSSDLVEYARQVYSTILEKYFGTYKIKLLEHLTPLTMINNARLQFNFQRFEDFVEELGSPFVHYFNQQLAVNSVQKQDNFSEMLSQLPFAAGFPDLLKTEKKGQICIALISQEASIAFIDESKLI